MVLHSHRKMNESPNYFCPCRYLVLQGWLCFCFNFALTILLGMWALLLASIIILESISPLPSLFSAGSFHFSHFLGIKIGHQIVAEGPNHSTGSLSWCFFSIMSDLAFHRFIGLCWNLDDVFMHQCGEVGEQSLLFHESLRAWGIPVKSFVLGWLIKMEC